MSALTIPFVLFQSKQLRQARALRDLAGFRVPTAPKFVASYRRPAPGFSFSKVGLSSTPLMLVKAVDPLRVLPTGAYIDTADSNGANKVQAPYKIHVVRDCP